MLEVWSTESNKITSTIFLRAPSIKTFANFVGKTGGGGGGYQLKNLFGNHVLTIEVWFGFFKLASLTPVEYLYSADLCRVVVIYANRVPTREKSPDVKLVTALYRTLITTLGLGRMCFSASCGRPPLPRCTRNFSFPPPPGALHQSKRPLALSLFIAPTADYPSAL